MTFLSTHFSQPDLQLVVDGIRKYIRLMGLIYDPNPLIWNKWFVDENDLHSSLRSVASAMKNTKPMIGQRKYQGIDYDAPREVTKLMHAFLLSGRTDGETSTLRKQHLPMLYLVLEPTIQLFYKFDHPTMINVADELIDDVVALLYSSTDYGTYDDALVAQSQVQAMIRAHESAKIAANAKRTKRPRRDPLMSLLASLAEPSPVEDEDAYA